MEKFNEPKKTKKIIMQKNTKQMTISLMKKKNLLFTRYVFEIIMK